jgi:hypothetical protein
MVNRFLVVLVVLVLVLVVNPYFVVASFVAVERVVVSSLILLHWEAPVAYLFGNPEVVEQTPHVNQWKYQVYSRILEVDFLLRVLL